MELEDDHKKPSFSFDIGGEKLGLIDISREEDFLIASPLFDTLDDLRLSDANMLEAFKSSGPQTLVKFENTEQVEPVRPSYLRKSLAWDNAFFNSAGVLDPDELTFINGGFNAVDQTRRLLPTTYEEIGLRRSFEPKSSKNASRKVDIDAQNMIKTKLVSNRQSINPQRSEKTKIETPRREKSRLSSLKPPKASSRIKNLLTGQSQSTSLNVYDVKIENKAATMSGKHRMLCKKRGHGGAITLPSGFLSSPRFSSVSSTSTQDRTGSSSSYDSPSSASCSKVPSALAKRKPESRPSKLCTTASTSERLLKKSKELGHPAFLTLPASIFSSFSCISPTTSSDASSSTPASRYKQQSYDLEAYGDTSGSLRRRGSLTNVIQGQVTNTSHRKSSLSLKYEEIKSPAQLNAQVRVSASPITAESRKILKPSCLRPPSPKIGFFDEEKMTAETAKGGLQFQFEIESTPPCKYGSTVGSTTDELLAAKTSPELSSEHNSQHTRVCGHAAAIKNRKASSDEKLTSSSPKRSNTLKNLSDGALRHHTHKGDMCPKCGKVGAGECDRRKVVEISHFARNDQGRVKERLKKRLGRDRKGQKDDISIQRKLVNPSEEERNSQQNVMDKMHLPNEDKRRTLTSFEDQVSDLSRGFEFIDLRRDMLVELKEKKDYPYTQSCGNRMRNHVETVSSCFDQQENLSNISPKPRLFSLSTADNIPSSRTPLADKTSVCNRSSSFDLSVESAKAKLVPKASAVSSFPVRRKQLKSSKGDHRETSN